MKLSIAGGGWHFDSWHSVAQACAIDCGEGSGAGVRPRKLKALERKQLLKLIFAERGGAKVTVTYGRRRLPCLWKVSEDTARCKLLDAGLAYLRRRRKKLP